MGRVAHVKTARMTRTFPGRPDHVREARHAVGTFLSGHPAATDAILIVSEFASNAVLHSRSKGDFFTVRVELHDTYCYIECEDLGGAWHLKPSDSSRPHGFDVVDALAGPDNWGADGSDLGRVVWARLEVAQ